MHTHKISLCYILLSLICQELARVLQIFGKSRLQRGDARGSQRAVSGNPRNLLVPRSNRAESSQGMSYLVQTCTTFYKKSLSERVPCFFVRVKGRLEVQATRDCRSGALAMIIDWCCSYNIILLPKKLVAAGGGGGTRGAAEAGVHQSARWL